MEISVNGETRTVSASATVAMLLDDLEITEGRVAVELNRQIVPRAEHAAVRLAEGDKVEIVTFVGGG